MVKNRIYSSLFSPTATKHEPQNHRTGTLLLTSLFLWLKTLSFQRIVLDTGVRFNFSIPSLPISWEPASPMSLILVLSLSFSLYTFQSQFSLALIWNFFFFKLLFVPVHSILKAIFLNIDYYPFSMSFCIEKPHSWLLLTTPSDLCSGPKQFPTISPPLPKPQELNLLVNPALGVISPYPHIKPKYKMR